MIAWCDEFSASAPDPAIWSAEVGGGGWGCGQLQHYTNAPANAYVDDNGRLAIVARAEPDGVVTSARLITKDRLTVRYGRIEARIRVPGGLGLWPAFWLLGSDIDDVGWPECGEIDVMEHVGSQPNVVHGTIHAPGYAGLVDGAGHGHDTGVDLAADFHVYGVEWTPDRIAWSVDGTTYNSLTPDDVPADTWPFRHDFYLLLNLAVGGDWPGNATDSPPLPGTLLVDWIRVYDSTIRQAG